MTEVENLEFIELIISTPLGYIMQGCYMLAGNFAVAIVLFTILTKVILLPLSIKQQHSSAKMAAVQPKIKAAQEKYKNNRAKQAEEIQRIYDEENYKPSAGCLPMLIQLPIIYGLIFVIYKPLTYILHIPAEAINQAAEVVGSAATQGWYGQLTVLNQYHADPSKFPSLEPYADQINNMDFNMFGLNLTERPDIGVISLLWIIPIAAGLFQILSMIIMQIMQKRNNPGMPMGSSMMMMLIFPIISVWIAFSVPAGVGFYWACSAAISTIQSVLMYTVYSPQKIAVRSEFKAAKKRLLAEQEKKEKRKQLSE